MKIDRIHHRAYPGSHVAAQLAGRLAARLARQWAIQRATQPATQPARPGAVNGPPLLSEWPLARRALRQAAFPHATVSSA